MILLDIKMGVVGKNILKTLVSARQFHVSSRLCIDPKTVEEIRIPVPWGHIAGKRWGDKNNQPAIALHGFLDNAASFDKLIPFLEIPSVLCLDFTGHGLSSHLPKGVLMNYLDNVYQLRYILKFLFKWDKNLIFIGHSFGSSVAFKYAALYPEEVSKMINIDCGRYHGGSTMDEFINKSKSCIENYLNTEKYIKSENGFTFDECVNHTMLARNSFLIPLSKENCETICSRGVQNMGNGKYYFTRDRRLKDFIEARTTREVYLNLANRVKCEVLNIHASRGINISQWGKEEEKHIQIMSKNCKSFVHLVLDGCHHIHLETPEVVAPHINKFLNK